MGDAPLIGEQLDLFASQRCCSTCRVWKPLAEFHKNRSKRSKVQTVCNCCAADYGRRYRRGEIKSLASRRMERVQ
jgi:hypothetical protein